MTVRHFRSIDRGAPTLTGQQGSLCALLEACLLKGYPSSAARSAEFYGDGTAWIDDTLEVYEVGQVIYLSSVAFPDANGPATVSLIDAFGIEVVVTGNAAVFADTPVDLIISGSRRALSGLVAVTSLTRSGSVVTVELAGHGFTVGQRATLKGATQPQYNGAFVVDSVADANHFTFTLPPSAGAPTTPATGTIYCWYGVDAAGWTMPYTATNKRVFRQGVKAGANNCVIRVNETDATHHTYGAGLLMAENATGVDTLTNSIFTTEYPQSTGMRKSLTNTTATRPWVLLADHRTMLLLHKQGANYSGMVADGWAHNYLGDIVSYLPGDAWPQYMSLMLRHTSYPFSSYPGDIDGGGQTNNYYVGNYLWANGGSDPVSPQRMLRNHLGAVGFVYASPYICPELVMNTTSGVTATHIGNWSYSTAYDTYPDPVTGGINFAKFLVVHYTTPPGTGNTVVRGHLRGLHCPLHRGSVITGVANNDTFEGSGPLAGKTFEVFKLQQAAQAWMIVETSDTWES